MVILMRRSSNFKGEFFLLTVFTIITFLFVISLWIKPSEIIDTSKVVLSEEIFVFNNVKEKVIEVINSSKTCEDLNFNLEEFKKFVERYGLRKGFRIEFNYTQPNCSSLPTLISINLSLTSPQYHLTKTFEVKWG